MAIKQVKSKQRNFAVQILERARALVAQGFVKNREDFSAEDAGYNRVSYTDQSAAYFSPSGATWRAESEILPTVNDAQLRIALQGTALSFLVKCAPKGLTLKRAYCGAGEIDEVLAWFDAAIEDARRNKPGRPAAQSDDL